MILYVVRHGETPSNLTGIVSGRSQETLTERGIEQAKELKQKLTGINFTAIYVSPMKRTIETAEIVAPDKKYIIDERISERDMGTLRNCTIHELWQMPLWNSLTEKRTPEGAETFAAGLERVQDFLDELGQLVKQEDVGRNAEEPKILVITHSFVSRCIWSIINNKMQEADFDEFLHRNDEIKIYYL